MKHNLLFALILCMAVAACSRDNNNNTAPTPVADAYVGNYLTNDTVSYNNGAPVTNYYSGSATFSKVSDNRIATTGFPHGNYCSGTQADVTVSTMSLVTNASCQSWFFSDFALTRNGTVLTYTYNYHVPGSPTFAVKGKAVKQ